MFIIHIYNEFHLPSYIVHQLMLLKIYLYIKFPRFGNGGYGLDDRMLGVRLSAEAGKFFRHRDQTGSEASTQPPIQ
jgi:hypothetical protein